MLIKHHSPLTSLTSKCQIMPSARYLCDVSLDLLVSLFVTCPQANPNAHVLKPVNALIQVAVEAAAPSPKTRATKM
jgi:hypothetical protein